MMSLGFVAVLATIILPLLVKTQTNSACLRLDLPAVPGSVECRVDNKLTTAKAISDGGSCRFLCKGNSVSAWRQCYEGEWQGDDLACGETGRLAVLKSLSRKKHPLFERKVHRVKRGWFFFGIIEDVIETVGCWLFSCGPPPDRTRPTIFGCPSDIHKTADPIQYHTHVTWEEPTANDDRDGPISTHRHGLAPGRRFSEGVTTMRYTAQDRSGNMATCSFKIHIHVIRCTPDPPRVNNGYRICHLSTDYRLGSVCWYGCYEGHELYDATYNTIQCLHSGRWSRGFQRCKKLECPKLRAPKHMELTCTEQWKFRSICTYRCTQPGYDIPPGRRRAHVCQGNKKWSGERVRCRDMENPKFLPYQQVIAAFADRGTNTTRVVFPIPSVKDNSLKTIIPRQVKGQKSGSTFSVGVHLIEFEAVDNAGNNAKNLKFKVIVKELVCYTLYRTPYQSVLCEEGYRYGSPCYFTCDEDFSLIGIANVTCERTGNPPFGAWTFGRRQPTCTLAKQCPALRAPDNGAMVCDTWFGGQYCQLQCRNGTDIPKSFDSWKLFQCGNSGIWNVKDYDLADRIPNCIKPKPGQKVKYRMEVKYYFNGDCNDNETVEQIKMSFLALLPESGFDCSKYKECSMENVKVICGTATRRKRDTQSQELTINVTFSYDLQKSNDLSEVSNWITEVMDGVKKAAQKGLTTGGGTELTLVSVENGKLTVSCPSGHLPNYNTFKCDPCDKGSFHDLSRNTCTLCVKGEYQDAEGQASCKQCPSGYTTAGKGAKGQGSCQAACSEGYVSRNGVAPCSPCELSTYQPDIGQASCVQCPGSMTTISQGSVSEADCAEFDIELESTGTAVAKTSLELEGLAVADGAVISWWMRTRESSESNLTQLLNILDDSAGEWLVVNAKHSSHITVNSVDYDVTLSITDDKWHFIRLDLTNSDCVVSVDDNDAISKPQSWMQGTKNVSQIILGGDWFVGSVSQFNIWSSQQLVPLSPTCRSHRTGDKLSWRKFVDANLTEAAISLPSECDDFDDCASNPCHHGTCTDALHSVVCQCNHGYEGSLCHANIDDCLENVCENNGSCVDQVGGFQCACTDLFTGELCEIAVVHGGWGEWDDWSECSVSCGAGVKVRKRACTKPSPDNGGRECEGSDSETEVCNQEICPVCKEIAEPDHGSLTCDNTTTLINCTLECDDGYLPDIEPLSVYYCSEDTSFIWNFETEQNPHRRLPVCSKTQDAEAISATYHIKYRDLHCSDNEAARAMVSDLVKSVLQSDVECVKDSNCFLDSLSVGCTQSGRHKRDVSDTNMGFSVTLKNNVSNPEIAAALETAIRKLIDNSKVGAFTVTIDGVPYYVELNQTDVHGDLTCPEGMASYSYFCVPCGPGSFLSHGSCMLCASGAYQGKSGQTECEQCPEGWTTDSLGARDISECSVQHIHEPDSNTAAIAIPVAISVVLVAVVIGVFLGVRRFGTRKKISRPTTPAYDLDEMPDRSDPQIPKHIFNVSEESKGPPTVAWDTSREDALHNDFDVMPNVSDPQIPKSVFLVKEAPVGASTVAWDTPMEGALQNDFDVMPNVSDPQISKSIFLVNEERMGVSTVAWDDSRVDAMHYEKVSFPLLTLTHLQ